jgi:hypothetical protein
VRERLLLPVRTNGNCSGTCHRGGYQSGEPPPGRSNK